MKKIVAALASTALLLGSAACLADAMKVDPMKEDATNAQTMKHDGMPRVTPEVAVKKEPMHMAPKRAMTGPKGAMAPEPATQDAARPTTQDAMKK